MDTPIANCVLSLHRFIKPLLYPRSVVDLVELNRFDEVFECIIAVYVVTESGGWKDPKDVTQIYAMLIYHIRDAIIYEATLRLSDFGGNILK